jgi:hypothetical protein
MCREANALGVHSRQTRGGIFFVRKLLMAITSVFSAADISVWPVTVRPFGGHLAFYSNTNHSPTKGDKSLHEIQKAVNF